MKHEYTDNKRRQLTQISGQSSAQEILIFGECDHIFVVTYEIIKYFGGLLHVNIDSNSKEINSHKGYRIEVHKKKWRNPLRHEPNYWLVDHLFIREFFSILSGDNLHIA